MKMERTECSETSAYKIRMLGNHQKERIQQSYPNLSSQKWWVTL